MPLDVDAAYLAIKKCDGTGERDRFTQFPGWIEALVKKSWLSDPLSQPVQWLLSKELDGLLTRIREANVPIA